jgi:hypothetical protein
MLADSNQAEAVAATEADLNQAEAKAESDLNWVEDSLIRNEAADLIRAQLGQKREESTMLVLEFFRAEKTRLVVALREAAEARGRVRNRRAAQSFDFVRNSLSGVDGCLVIRFEEKENRDKAIVILNQLRCYSHIEPIDSSWPDGVHYRRRGLGLGRYIIVVDSDYVHDTWHCAEYEHLDKNGIKFNDIDYVNYSEITGAI